MSGHRKTRVLCSEMRCDAPTYKTRRSQNPEALTPLKSLMRQRQLSWRDKRSRPEFGLGHADDGGVVAGHAGIADIGGAASEDTEVRCRGVGVRADDEAGAAVAKE